ncbi:MAG: molybdopterin-dependent oxidoreductase, partial [Deltaproteobacteria bacterium]|nr:molybdopterin-dependent oxidoreductase [Deltaproteobacteria bacterium]
VAVQVEGGRVTRVEGDPQSPTSRGRLCIKGRTAPFLAHHSDRLTVPLRRSPHGWKEISWEDALGEISHRFLEIRDRWGSEALVLGYGTGRDNEAFIYRFANLFGTPNVLTAGHMCYGPRIATGIATCGNLPVVDYGGNPQCIMVWGSNPVISHPDEYKGFDLVDSLKRGVRLIIVDPRKTALAKRADIWLPLRPGTDGALAWGLLNATIEHNLYDAGFVANHVHGWEHFCGRMREYPLSWAAEVTGLKPKEIEDAAELFARSSPAAIHWGVAIEQGRNCTSTIRLLISLMAITGNLDLPGGNVFFNPPPVVRASELGLHKRLSPDQRKKRLGGERFRLADFIGVINPKAVWEAILEETPYPVRGLFLISTNPLITRANARQVKAALEKVDFLVVADFFLTPSAKEADIVLPSSTWLEVDYVADLWKRHGMVMARQKAVQIGQCWSDYRILNELGKRVGDEKDWWPTVKDALNHILSPSGLTWEEFCQQGYLRGDGVFGKHLQKGFSTPTRKVELYSTFFERLGYDPLPGYLEPAESPRATPELLTEYPYTLITGARVPYFFHSEYRMVEPLRRRHPDPLVEVNPHVAREKGLRDGDWAEIRSQRGSCKQRVKITDAVPYGIVAAEHGWWFPEEKDGLGWDRSNINLLTENDFDSCDQAMGATNLRTLLCDIHKVPPTK